MPSSHPSDPARLQAEIFSGKVPSRMRRGQAPILEKLRVLEEMRAFSQLLQSHRDENKRRLAARSV